MAADIAIRRHVMRPRCRAHEQTGRSVVRATLAGRRARPTSTRQTAHCTTDSDMLETVGTVRRSAWSWAAGPDDVQVHSVYLVFFPCFALVFLAGPVARAPLSPCVLSRARTAARTNWRGLGVTARTCSARAGVRIQSMAWSVFIFVVMSQSYSLYTDAGDWPPRLRDRGEPPRRTEPGEVPVRFRRFQMASDSGPPLMIRRRGLGGRICHPCYETAPPSAAAGGIQVPPMRPVTSQVAAEIGYDPAGGTARALHPAGRRTPSRRRPPLGTPHQQHRPHQRRHRRLSGRDLPRQPPQHRYRTRRPLPPTPGSSGTPTIIGRRRRGRIPLYPGISRYISDPFFVRGHQGGEVEGAS